MNIEVTYHPDVDYHGRLTVWADSPDLPGYTAFASSVVEAQALVAEGVELLHPGGKVTLAERMEPPHWFHVNQAEFIVVEPHSCAGGTSSWELVPA